MKDKTDFQEALQCLKEQGRDVYMYCGPVERAGYNKICDAISEAVEENRKSEKVVLFLCTYGGDPNAGYRIARAMIHHYGSENFEIAVPTACKSAGTLICIGANKLLFFNSGELGPLDIQIQKQDEIFQSNSGLDILRGMTYLQDGALTAFKRYLVDINKMGGISTKIASEIAGNLVKGLYTPIFAQVDPLKLGEMNAALQIANEYGSRLNEKSKSLKEHALNKLIHTYPAHSFVVDRSEAKTLFERVESPDENVLAIGSFATRMFKFASAASESFVLDLTNTFAKKTEDTSDEQPGDAASTVPPTEGNDSQDRASSDLTPDD